MDKLTLDKASIKVLPQSFHVKMPDVFINNQGLEKKYEDLPNYIDFTKSLDIFEYYQGLIRYKKKTEMNDYQNLWPLPLFYSNPHLYYIIESPIFVPFLSLQGQFYDDDHPDEMTFGKLGFLSAHEIGLDRVRGYSLSNISHHPNFSKTS